MKIKYIHLRKLDSDGKPLTKGGATIAYRSSPHPFQHEETLVEYVVAYCSDKDNFSKKIGRHISGGRLDRYKVAGNYLVLENNPTNSEIVKELVQRIDGTF